MSGLNITYNLATMRASRRVLRRGFNRVIDGPGFGLGVVARREFERVNGVSSTVPRALHPEVINTVEDRFREMGLELMFTAVATGVSDQSIIKSAMYRPANFLRGRRVEFKLNSIKTMISVPLEIGRDALWQLKGVMTLTLDHAGRESKSAEEIATILSRCDACLADRVLRVANYLNNEDKVAVMTSLNKTNPQLAEAIVELDFEGFRAMIESDWIDQDSAIALMLCFPKVRQLYHRQDQSQPTYRAFTQESLGQLNKIKPSIAERFPAVWASFREQYGQMVNNSIYGTGSSSRQLVIEDIVKTALAQLVV